MESQFLLPHKFQRFGWLAIFFGFIGFTLLLILSIFLIPWGEFVFNNDKYKPDITFIIFLYAFLFTILLVFVGILLIGIAKEKTEDEYISQLRIRSFLNAILYTYIWYNAFYFFTSENHFYSTFKWSFISVIIGYVLDFQFRLNYPDYWEKAAEEMKSLFKNAE